RRTVEAALAVFESHRSRYADLPRDSGWPRRASVASAAIGFRTGRTDSSAPCPAERRIAAAHCLCQTRVNTHETTHATEITADRRPARRLRAGGAAARHAAGHAIRDSRRPGIEALGVGQRLRVSAHG